MSQYSPRNLSLNSIITIFTVLLLSIPCLSQARALGPTCVQICNDTCTKRNYDCKLDCEEMFQSQVSGSGLQLSGRTSCYTRCNTKAPACSTNCSKVCDENPPSSTATNLQQMCYENCIKSGQYVYRCLDICKYQGLDAR